MLNPALRLPGRPKLDLWEVNTGPHAGSPVAENRRFFERTDGTETPSARKLFRLPLQKLEAEILVSEIAPPHENL
jgi:hypothetical protein